MLHMATFLTNPTSPPAHPHAGGEHGAGAHPRPSRRRLIPTQVGNTRGVSGSSTPVSAHPHAGGEHATDRPLEFSAHRLIPTQVGNTERCPPPGCQSPAHPHAGGEHSPIISLGAAHPHAGGEHITGPHQCRTVHRLIPTQVGNTMAVDLISVSARGSSPRRWGTQDDQLQHGHRWRLIPTQVGNT